MRDTPPHVNRDRVNAMHDAPMNRNAHARHPVVALRVSREEKDALQAEADSLGITVSVLIYRKLFDKPDAQRQRFGTPRGDHDEEGLFRMTG